MGDAVSTLRAFKARHRLTWRQVAELLEISPDFARKLGSGQRKGTSRQVAERIEKRTAGEIRATDLWA